MGLTSMQTDSVEDIEFSRLSNNNNSPDVHMNMNHMNNMDGVELIPLDQGIHGNTDNLAFLDQLSMPMNMMSPPNNLFSSPTLLSGSNMMMGSVTNMSMSSGNGNGNGIEIYQ